MACAASVHLASSSIPVFKLGGIKEQACNLTIELQCGMRCRIISSFHLVFNTQFFAGGLT